MVVPAAPLASFNSNSECERAAPSPRSDEEAVIFQAGWRLGSTTRLTDHVDLLDGTAGWAAMCRSEYVQQFVFYDGTFLDNNASAKLSPLRWQWGDQSGYTGWREPPGFLSALQSRRSPLLPVRNIKADLSHRPAPKWSRSQSGPRVRSNRLNFRSLLQLRAEQCQILRSTLRQA